MREVEEQIRQPLLGLLVQHLGAYRIRMEYGTMRFNQKQ
jgi:hypothetical protein